MTTYLSFLSWFLAARYDRDENAETTQVFEGMAEKHPESAFDWLEEIVWGLNRNDV